jgi:capsule polysaccharide export protein KpsE/RkpR
MMKKNFGKATMMRTTTIIDKIDINIVIIIFLTYFILDMFYAYYILCIESRKNLMSSFMAGIITSLSAFGVVSFSKNMVYVIPLFLGAFAGTFVTMKAKEILQSRKRKVDNED